MRKLLLFLFTILSATITNAQFEIGQKSLGGNLMLFNNTVKNDSLLGYGNPTQFAFSINPEFSKFVRNNWLVGFGIIYGYNKYSTKSLGGSTSGLTDSKSLQQSIGFNNFINNYTQLGKNFYFLINWNSSVLYTFGATKDPNYNLSEKGFRLTTSIDPGLAYKITERFLIESIFGNFLYLQYFNSSMTRTQLNGRSQTASISSLGFYTSLKQNPLEYMQIGFRYLLRDRKGK